MIQIDLIEAHSLICQKVTPQVRQVEDLDAIDYCVEKINGLDKQLKKLHNDQRLQPGDRTYVALLTTHIEEAK